MLLKTKVKVGNITNLSDARYCAGMGVDMLGFPIGTAPNQITTEVFQKIADWVAGPEFVFEYADTIDDDQFEKVTQIASIRHIQLTYSQLGKLRSKLNNKSVILVTNEAEWTINHQTVSGDLISFLILDDQGPINWKRVEEINQKVPVLIPQTRIKSELQEITSLPISGIVLEGSSEDRPGHKDYDHLSTVLESLEIN